jgi:hypothetical protein
MGPKHEHVGANGRDALVACFLSRGLQATRYTLGEL